MTKFRFAVYGIVHAGNEKEAKASLENAMEEYRSEKYDILVEEILD